MKEFGSNYWCYKGTNSFVLMAIVDANYKFVFIDVGINGRIGDAGIWMRSDLRRDIEANVVPIPAPSYLPATQVSSPYVFVADDAFPLTNYIMKPYSHKELTEGQRRFNYMLSRNRRVVENAFGILANRFQVLFAPIFREPNEAIKVALACICLHNFLREDNIKNSSNWDYISNEEIEAVNVRHFQPTTNRTVGAPVKKAAEVRSNFEKYFTKFYPQINLD